MTSLCSSFGSTLFSMPYKFPVLFTLLFDINFHVLALLVIALSSLYIPPIEERAITNSAKTWKLISKSKVKRTGCMYQQGHSSGVCLSRMHSKVKDPVDIDITNRNPRRMTITFGDLVDTCTILVMAVSISPSIVHHMRILINILIRILI